MMFIYVLETSGFTTDSQTSHKHTVVSATETVTGPMSSVFNASSDVDSNALPNGQLIKHASDFFNGFICQFFVF